jgi:putative ABC transport system permease protein
MSRAQSPPRFFLRLFQWYCRPKLRGHIEGDLIEDYNRRLNEAGKRRADLIFAFDVILLFRPGIVRSLLDFRNLKPSGMFRNYFKITVRIFNREKLYSLINVSGLALGFACCLMIYLFIRDEISYDKFHNDASRIYRIAAAYMRQGVWEPYSTNAWRTSELIKTNFGKVEDMVKIMSDENMFAYKDKRIYETHIAWVDDNFFQLFNFPLIEGNASQVLKGPNKVVISESIALKYFGTADAIGKVFEVQGNTFQVAVTGVMKDMPANSHFHFNILISNETLKQVAPEGLFTNVGWDSQYTYIKVASGTEAAKMEAAFPDFINKNLDFFKSTNFKLFLQPLLSIHLESHNGTEIEENGTKTRVYIFSVVAVFILVIACINYVNLTTARSLRRAREAGMRKVLGAKRRDLINQFLTESFMMTVLAFFIALLLVLLLLPEFNRFSGKAIAYSVLLEKEIVLTLLISVLTIALASGIYPAAILSSLRSTNNLKGSDGSKKSGFTFRKVLVVLQFSISIGLIAASAVVFQQWEFLKNKELGINKEMLIAIPLQTMDRNKLGSLREELLANPSVKNVGACNMRMPGWISNSTSYRAEGAPDNDDTQKSMKIMRVDYDFFPAIEAAIIDGRNFSRDFPADSAAILVNESALEQLAWKEGVGKWIELGRQKFNIIGIVRDFHFESLHRKIPPTIFIKSRIQLNWLYVRIENQNLPSTIEKIQKTYSGFVQDRDFTYSFVNEDIKQQYTAEAKFTQVFSLFTLLAIIIACLGTFGLISFTAERKSKEIGIRKVLGASVGNVSYLLIREFMLLLLIASVVALPLTWFFLDGWIDTFVYRTTIGTGPFVLAILLAGLIVVATTGFRAVKAALANPIDSLRDE